MPTPSAVQSPSQVEANYRLGYIWSISLVAALGGLLFGYDWVVIGGAKPFFEPYFGIHDEAVRGWANSCALLGCLLGAVTAGALSDRFGRKWLLSLSAVLFLVTSLGNATATNFSVFIGWRILGGVAIGLASNLSPMYISEISPAGMRGRLVSINQLTIVIGILLAQIVNWRLGRGLQPGATAEMIRDSWYGQYCWRWMFAATAVPSLMFFLGMFIVPESPRWLVKNRMRERARNILERIGGPKYAENACRDIEATVANEVQAVDFRELIDPRIRKVLVLGVVLAVLQQWCAANVLFNYAEEIFKAAGYDISDVLSNIALTGVVNLIFTFVALGVVDRGGRRPLMLFGSAGLAILYTAIGGGYALGLTGWPMLVLVLSVICCYSMSLAPITWVVISEIFPNRIRGAAMAVAVSALWIACFVLTYTFPVLIHRLGAACTFWVYAAICGAGFVFIFLRLPETKGKTLEQIERELVD
jgi:sugar porter (SP) family MFS transporter